MVDSTCFPRVVLFLVSLDQEQSVSPPALTLTQKQFLSFLPKVQIFATALELLFAL